MKIGVFGLPWLCAWWIAKEEEEEREMNWGGDGGRIPREEEEGLRDLTKIPLPSLLFFNIFVSDYFGIGTASLIHISNSKFNN